MSTIHTFPVRYFSIVTVPKEFTIRWAKSKTPPFRAVRHSIMMKL